jgi:hypothetical protein
MNLSRSLTLAFIAGVLLALAADSALIATGNQKSELWGSSIVGFWAVLGFISFLVIVGVAKLLGDRLVSRPEGYYDRDKEHDDV